MQCVSVAFSKDSFTFETTRADRSGSFFRSVPCVVSGGSGSSVNVPNYGITQLLRAVPNGWNKANIQQQIQDHYDHCVKALVGADVAGFNESATKLLKLAANNTNLLMDFRIIIKLLKGTSLADKGFTDIDLSRFSIQSETGPGVVIDVQGAIFYGADLDFTDLSYLNLSGSDCTYLSSVNEHTLWPPEGRSVGMTKSIAEEEAISALLEDDDL